VSGHQHSFDNDVRFLTMVANLIGQTVRLHRSVSAERAQLQEEKRRLKRELQGKYSLDNVVGISKAMQEVFAEVHQSAPSRSTMLLRGESGTGKEVMARAIHYLSPRKDGPFIKLNCAALSESLLESELFGHEKGAFTGAQAERKGRFELANGGTLFLDEIGDISPAFQAKLLRVLQEREFERVGGSRSIKVDVRLITATNRDLESAVAKGEFRADLYYRINVVSIFIPPLRERREDIPYLVEHFLAKYGQENGREFSLAPQALNTLMNCYWPGNVRQLENCIERTATMARNRVINDEELSCYQNKCLTQVLHEPAQIEYVHAPGAGGERRQSAVIPIKEVRPEADTAQPPSSERERLVWAMEQCGWVQAKAARLLNISARQMGYALQKYGIEIKRF
jgi:Nif-specific regulatory protein